MAEQVHTQIGNGENQYATPEDFRRILDEDLNLLYQLSFLLTTDHQKAERCLVESIEDCANSFGAQRVPAVMRAIEVLGIEQARSWNLASLNEFRQYFGLEPHRTFDSINSDPIVAEQLKRLYEHPDIIAMMTARWTRFWSSRTLPGQV